MAKRRLTAAPVEPDKHDRPMSWAALATGAVLVGLVVLAGVGLQAASDQRPSGALAGCKLPPQLAPRVFTSAPAMCIDAGRQYSAEMTTTKGKVTIALDAKDAPRTVNNFVVLAGNGYYNGLDFWRVEDWVTQTGDPTGSGRFSPGYSLPEEAGKSGWAPGALGFARSGSALNGAQFFITKTAWPGGDPPSGYNHFADVTLGFDIVGQLTSTDKILSISIRTG